MPASVPPPLASPSSRPSVRPEDSLRAAAAAKLVGAHRRPAVLLGLGAVLSAIDWLLPLSGALSFFVTAALSALVLPWIAVVVRSEPPAGAAAQPIGSARRVLPP